MENTSQSSSNPIPQGCGPNTQINIHVSPTTGGDFYLSVEPDITIENLKKLVSKRLKVPRDRICLLFRDKWVSKPKYSYFYFLIWYVFRQLQDGNLVQHGISDGSRITLLPNVETGLIVCIVFSLVLHNITHCNYIPIPTKVNLFALQNWPIVLVHKCLHT